VKRLRFRIDLDQVAELEGVRGQSRAPVVDAWHHRWQNLLEIGPIFRVGKKNGRTYLGRNLHMCIFADMSQDDFLKAWGEL
jgi:hypothetical protein